MSGSDARAAPGSKPSQGSHSGTACAESGLLRPAVFAPVVVPEYELLDSGAAWKLERFGARTLARPDPQALWEQRLDASEWKAADMTFVRESDRGGRFEWRGGARGGQPDPWNVRIGALELVLRPTPFKHVGLFPEQATNWAFLERARAAFSSPPRPRLLNLFGYTGAASVWAAQAGYSVVHVDASKTMLEWGRQNQRASRLEADAIRWLQEDALAFARREARRGARYAGILLDPPHHGRGPKGEVWQLEEHINALVEVCGQLLEERAFLILSTYAVGHSPLALANLLETLPDGQVSAGELALEETAREGRARRRLPCGFCARFVRGFEMPSL